VSPGVPADVAEIRDKLVVAVLRYEQATSEVHGEVLVAAAPRAAVGSWGPSWPPPLLLAPKWPPLNVEQMNLTAQEVWTLRVA